LFNENNNGLLDDIFDHIKIYDNEFIKVLLYHYRNKAEISISDMNRYISNDKYKILTTDLDNQCGCGKYLSIECSRGKEINSTKVEFLVEHGADINGKDNLGETPLIKACRSGKEAIVKYFIEHGADVNKKNKRGETPLIISCEMGYEAIVMY